MAVINFANNFQGVDPSLYFKKKAPAYAAAQQLNEGLQNATPIVENLIAQKKAAKDQKDWEDSVDSWANQNPQFASMAPIMKKDKALAGQLLPGLIKQQSQSQKPTQSIWRTQSGETSLEPQQGPVWKEYSGFTPQQAQSTFNQGIGAQARKQWAEQLKSRTEMGYVQNIYNDLNTLDKSSGGVLGQAAQIQYRAQRGQHLLNTPGIANDKLVYGLVKSDLAAIAQGGSPTMAAQEEANVPTMREEANGLLRRLTAYPKDIDQPEVKKQALKIFQVMDKSSGQIFQQNTQGLRDLYGSTDWYKQNPGVFDQAAKALGQGIKPFDTSKLPPLPPSPNDVPSYQETVPMGDQ